MRPLLPNLSRRAVLAMLAGSGLVRFSPEAFAQSYPERAVKIVVGFAAGGPTDIMARLIASKLSENTGKQFYVDDQGGAGGNLAMGAAAHAAPDGLTILLAASSFAVNPGLYKMVPYDPVKDFIPITIVGDSPNVFIVNPSFPAKNMKELIDLAKANPGKYSYASGGTGALAQLSFELLKTQYGLNIIHVPHRGAGPAIQSVLGNFIPMSCVTLPSALPMIREGQLRALGVTSGERFPSAQDIPTLKEQGIPDQDNANWQAVMVPAGTPKPIVDFLYREITKIVHDPKMRERFIQLGFTPIDSTPQQVAEHIAADLKKWKKVIRDAKIELQ